MKTRSLALLSFASVLAFAGCTNKLPKDKLDGAVKSAFEKAGIAFKSVNCPADKEVKAGDKFECEGELDEGVKATITVTQKDDKGSLGFDIVGSVEKESAIAEFITKKSGNKTELSCPKKLTVLKKGETFTCDLTQGAEKGKLVATALDNDKVNYKVEMDGKAAAAPVDAEPDAPVEAAAAP